VTATAVGTGTSFSVAVATAVAIATVTVTVTVTVSATVAIAIATSIPVSIAPAVLGKCVDGGKHCAVADPYRGKCRRGSTSDQCHERALRRLHSFCPGFFHSLRVTGRMRSSSVPKLQADRTLVEDRPGPWSDSISAAMILRVENTLFFLCLNQENRRRFRMKQYRLIGRASPQSPILRVEPREWNRFCIDPKECEVSLQHSENHFVARVGWLRATVLGANDGLTSTASLILGVASASAETSSILVAGVAGLVAGAMSMAAGEYVSVSSQSDTERADLARERRELATQPDTERKELAQIYVSRGVDLDLARPSGCSNRRATCLCKPKAVSSTYALMALRLTSYAVRANRTLDVLPRLDGIRTADHLGRQADTEGNPVIARVRHIGILPLVR
jgi:hypothetical protein